MSKDSLTGDQFKKGKENIKKIERENPLRRVMLKCEHGWVRDPMAKVGDWIWCQQCGDLKRVEQVVE